MRIAAGLALTALLGAVSFDVPAFAARSSAATEDYVREPMPPGIQVLNNELEGPVFADARGHTLYTWPFHPMRRGEAGDHIGKSSCENRKTTENGGFMEPYPGGLTLPDLDHRPTCVEMWPPVLADAGAKSVGPWSTIARDDGTRQWAYRGQAVYTSALDHQPGDVWAASKRQSQSLVSRRLPLGPPPNIPPGFAVTQTVVGRVLVMDGGSSVYTWDKDGTNKSNCGAACLVDWKPVLAPALAESRGEFTVFERVPGIKQWAFRGRPLYTYVQEPVGEDASLIGSDVPDWHNVYTQHVWAYRDRPVYTFSGDREPGDRYASGWGETEGSRNGYLAMVLRDDFFGHDR